MPLPLVFIGLVGLGGSAVYAANTVKDENEKTRTLAKYALVAGAVALTANYVFKGKK